METIEIEITKPYALQILLDLELIGAIKIIRNNVQPSDYSHTISGSWGTAAQEAIEAQVDKLLNEWERS